MDLRDDSAERTPLLQEQSDSSFPSYNVQARDELPPPYSPQYATQGNIVPCRVCGYVIDITNRRDQHVVKCSRCNEATPIRHAPHGKKYVRCPCNCLLICNVTSQRIGCPRANCHRIINLAPSTTNIPPASVPGLCRVSCVHCQQTFLFNTLNNALSRCPHCRKVSSVGPQFARTRGILSLILALVILAITLGITLGTYQYAVEKKGIYVVYACGLIAFLLFLLRSLYYLTMRVSHIEEPA